MNNIVWILGSGFSQPLGGPTLAQLFSANAHRELDATYPSGDAQWTSARGHVFEPVTRWTRRLFLVGAKEDHGTLEVSDEKSRGVFRGMWVDAEDFLDQLETAALAPQGALARKITNLLTAVNGGSPLPVERVRTAARRLLAVECSRFLLESETASERWEPFRRWRDLIRAASVDYRHTIITFNYDRVLEKLGFGDLVLLPHQAVTLGDLVLKLHGSVDWKRTGKTFERLEDEHFAATCDDEELAIAPPGPAKARMTEDLEALWKEAERRLGEASAVCFVGYRFPPTDSTARTRLLRAIPNNGFQRQVHVVLGPDVRHSDVLRLEGLLVSRVGERRVKLHPMFTQDFLSVFELHHL
jgi:hypothetical protein